METLTDLTAREAQIAKLARDGHTNQEIAVQLFISPHTVEWHLGNVFTKLGITSAKTSTDLESGNWLDHHRPAVVADAHQDSRHGRRGGHAASVELGAQGPWR